MLSRLSIGRDAHDRVGLSDRQPAFVDDKTARQKVAATIPELIRTYQEYDSKYAATVDPGTEADLYVKVKTAWNAYTSLSQRFQALLEANKHAEAKTICSTN